MTDVPPGPPHDPLRGTEADPYREARERYNREARARADRSQAEWERRSGMVPPEPADEDDGEQPE